MNTKQLHNKSYELHRPQSWNSQQHLPRPITRVSFEGVRTTSAAVNQRGHSCSRGEPGFGAKIDTQKILQLTWFNQQVIPMIEMFPCVCLPLSQDECVSMGISEMVGGKQD